MEEKIFTLDGNIEFINKFILKVENRIETVKPEKEVERRLTEIFNSFYDNFMNKISNQRDKLSYFEKKRLYITLKNYLFVSILKSSSTSKTI